jgi:hypothetical protein
LCLFFELFVHYRYFSHVLKQNVAALRLYGMHEGRTQGRAAGLQTPTQTPQNRNLKHTDFVFIMISKVSLDFPFSRNQPLKSADD